jgi:hypothetical protein
MAFRNTRGTMKSLKGRKKKIYTPEAFKGPREPEVPNYY